MISLICDQRCKKFKYALKTNEMIIHYCRSLVDNNNVLLARQSKLEHFGFDMLPRSTTTLKRQLCKEKPKPINNSLVIIQRNNKSKKMRTIE